MSVTYQQDNQSSSTVPTAGRQLALQARQSRTADVIAGLESLSPKDLINLFKLIPQGRGAVIYNALIELEKKNDPNFEKLSYNEQLNKLDTKYESMSSENILKIVEDICSIPNNHQYKNHLEELKSLISSEFFASTYAKIARALGFSSVETHTTDVAILIRSNPNNLHEKVSTISTPEFIKDYNLLKTKLKFEPAYSLNQLLNVYLNPEYNNMLTSDKSHNVYSFARKEFPDIENSFDSFMKINLGLANSYNQESFESLSEQTLISRLRKTKESFDSIKDFYGLKAQTAQGICDLSRVSDISILFDDQIKDLHAGLKKQDLPVTRKQDLIEFLGFRGFLSLAVTWSEHIDTSFDNFNQLLKITKCPLDENTTTSLYMLRESYFSVSTLAKSKGFKEFVEKVYSKYPELTKNIDINIVAALAKVYVDKDIFWELNDSIQKFSAKKFPEFYIENAESKIGMLEAVKAMKYERIVLNPGRGSGIGAQNEFSSLGDYNLDLSALLRSPKANALYQSLVNNWNLKQIELGWFTGFLTNVENGEKESLKLYDSYLSKDTAQKFNEMVKIFNAKAYHGNKNGVDTYGSVDSLDDLILIDGIFSYLDIIIDPKNRAIMESIWNHKDKANGRTLMDLDSIVLMKDLTKIESYKTISELLKTAYKITPEETSFFLPDSSDVDESLKKLSSKEFQEFYAWNRDTFLKNAIIDGEKATATTILSISNKIDDFKEFKQIGTALRKMGYGISSWDEFEVIQKLILTDKNLFQTINNPSFQSFSRKISDQFYGHALTLDKIEHLRDLFHETNRIPKGTEILNSQTFQDVISFLRTEFDVTSLNPSTLPGLLRIADGFNPGKVSSVVNMMKANKESLSANDFILIADIARTPDLLALYKDRPKLIKEASEIYLRDAKPRGSLDEVTSLNSKKSYLSEAGKKKIDEEIQDRKASYTERPSLETISNLQLLRLVLLNRSLKSESIKAELGKILNSDIKDKKTEYGGIIGVRNGKVSIESIRSISEFDGSYENTKYNYFNGGMASFHLHALEKDTTKYSGPSGWLAGYGGDIPYVDHYKSTDLVITAMGHPIDKNGTEIKSKLLINIDMYYIDRRSPNGKSLRIIDLGSFEVPIQ